MPEAVGLSGPLACALKGRRGWLVLAALGVVLVALRGATLLFDHSLHSIDGAMQTWFAADNFADGAKLGKEFQSYLGITMILTLLPGFIAFGETLWASTFMAHAMVIAGGFAGAYAIVWMVRPVPPNQRWMWAILLIIVFYYVGPVLAQAIGLPYPATFDPGVSLRPLRGALPFFVLPVFVWALRRILATERARPAFVFGLVAGAGLLWSNDAGIPLVIASCIGLGAGLLREVWLLAKSLLVFTLGVMVSAGAILLLVTHGDPGGWLQYNYVDVPSDQYWYFAPWNRDARVLSITDLPSIFMQGQWLSTFSLNVLTASVIVAMVRRFLARGSSLRTCGFIFVGSSVVGTALIPQIGGHIGSEYNSITFVLGMCAPLIVFQNALFVRAKPVLRLAPRLSLPLAAAAASIGMIAVEGVHLTQTASNTDRTVYAEKLGFYVTPQTAEDLAAMERLSNVLEDRGFPEDERLLSVYTSALDIAAGTKSPAPVGSIIHALGERNRIQYIEALTRKAVAVTTIAPDYTGWAGWNERANWPFFKNLRDLYRPVARSHQHILWIRSGDGLGKQDASCEVTDWGFASFELTITSPQSGIASVFMEREGFDAQPRTALLTVTESSPFTRAQSTPQWSDFPRYGIANARQIEVSAPVEAGEKTRLTFEVLDGSAIGWGECFARVYEPVDYAALPSLSDGIDQLIMEGAQ